MTYINGFIASLFIKKDHQNYTDAPKRWMTKKIQIIKKIKYCIATHSHLQALSIHETMHCNEGKSRMEPGITTVNIYETCIYKN